MTQTPTATPPIQTQPNEKRCYDMEQVHLLSISNCCPVSKNPLPGSELEISYKPNLYSLEVASLRRYVNSYVGGRGDVRSMEGMIQSIAKDCAKTLGVNVCVIARLNIAPEQKMVLNCLELA